MTKYNYYSCFVRKKREQFSTKSNKQLHTLEYLIILMFKSAFHSIISRHTDNVIGQMFSGYNIHRKLAK